MDGGVGIPRHSTEGASTDAGSGQLQMGLLLEDADGPLIGLFAAAAWVSSAGLGYRTVNDPDSTGFTAIMGRKPYEDLDRAVYEAALLQIAHLIGSVRSALEVEPFREAFDRLVEVARSACEESGLHASRFAESLRIKAATHRALHDAVNSVGFFLPEPVREAAWTGNAKAAMSGALQARPRPASLVSAPGLAP